jgi:hypothetical protein
MRMPWSFSTTRRHLPPLAWFFGVSVGVGVGLGAGVVTGGVVCGGLEDGTGGDEEVTGGLEAVVVMGAGNVGVEGMKGTRVAGVRLGRAVGVAVRDGDGRTGVGVEVNPGIGAPVPGVAWGIGNTCRGAEAFDVSGR